MPVGGISEWGRFYINEKGYPRLSRLRRYVHHISFEKVAGRPVREGFQVHHMNGKLCWCPHQLLEIQTELHQAKENPRCPYTGRFLTKRELESLREQQRTDNEVPF